MNNTDHHRCDPVEVGITGHQGGAFVIVFPRLVKEKPCAPRVPTIMASISGSVQVRALQIKPSQNCRRWRTQRKVFAKIAASLPVSEISPDLHKLKPLASRRNVT